MGVQLRFSLFFVALSCSAQIAPSMLSGTTAAGSGFSVTVSPLTQQAQLTFTAPANTTCTVAASESPTLSPLLADVDPSLYSGSNQDNRTGSVNNGTSRIFILGKRAAERALDGYFHSRSLKPLTTVYYQISGCGGTATGSFTTDNILLGNTFNEDVPPDLSLSTAYYVPGGQYAYPQFLSMVRGANPEVLPDTQSGIGVQLVTYPQDFPFTGGFSGTHSFTTATSVSGWTNPGNILLNSPGVYATFSGAGSGKLAVIDTVLFDNSGNFYTIDSAVLSITGLTTGSSSPIIACPTVNNANCWPTNGTTKTQTANLTGSLSTVTLGTTTPILDSWTPAGSSPLLGQQQSLYGDMQQRSGNVNVDGSGNVSLVIPTQNSITNFNLNWSPGSIVTIGSSVCIITSAVTITAFTITPSACSPALTVPVSSAPYSATNFGWLIWTTDTVNTIKIQYATYSITSSLPVQWPASGSPDLFDLTQLTNSTTGHAGYLMQVPGTGFYFFDTVTGQGNALSTINYPSKAGTDGWGNGSGQACNNASTTITGSGPFKIYCTGLDNTGTEVLITFPPSSTLQPGSWNWNSGTNLTPSSINADLLSLLVNFTTGQTPSFNKTTFSTQGCGISGLQQWSNGDPLLIGDCVQSQQDTYGWVYSFDPVATTNGQAGNAGCVSALGGGPGCVMAAMSTWGGGSSTSPNRWCTLHTLFSAGQANTSTMWIAGKTLTNGGSAGQSFQTSTVSSGTIGTSPQFAPGTGGCPGGVPHGCNTLTLAAQPNGSDGFIQNIAVGDVISFQGGGSGENVQVLSTSGGSTPTISVSRGVSDSGLCTSSGGSACPSGTITLYMQCSAAVPHGSESWTWNYTTDPHGLNGGGQVATAYYIDHPTPRPSYVVGADGWSANPGEPPTGGYAALTSLTASSPTYYLSLAPLFGGIKGIPQFVEAAQDHTSGYGDSQTSANYMVDFRTGETMDTVNSPTSKTGTAIHISGNTYYYAGTTSNGDDFNGIGGSGIANSLNRKVQPTMAFCGTQPLTDISGPASGLPGTYQYCEARTTTECGGGRTQGDIVFTCPNLVPLPLGGIGLFSQNDVGFFNTGAWLNAPSQYSWANGTDPNAQYARGLGHFLTRQRFLNVNANGRVTPDGSWYLTWCIAVNGVWNAVCASRLPSFPTPDAVQRWNPVPYTINITASGGSTAARVDFGYFENGSAPTDYHCMTRLDKCQAVTATIPASPQIFSWGSESATGLFCPVSCTIQVPALSRHFLYYQVELLIGGTWMPQGLQVARIQ